MIAMLLLLFDVHRFDGFLEETYLLRGGFRCDGLFLLYLCLCLCLCVWVVM